MKKVFLVLVLILMGSVLEVMAYSHAFRSSTSRSRLTTQNAVRNVVLTTAAVQLATRHQMSASPLKTGIVDSIFIKDGKSYVKIESLYPVSSLKDFRTDSLVQVGDSVSLFVKDGNNCIISEVAAVVDNYDPMLWWVLGLVCVIIVALVVAFGICINQINN